MFEGVEFIEFTKYKVLALEPQEFNLLLCTTCSQTTSKRHSLGRLSHRIAFLGKIDVYSKYIAPLMQKTPANFYQEFVDFVTRSQSISSDLLLLWHRKYGHRKYGHRNYAPSITEALSGPNKQKWKTTALMSEVQSHLDNKMLGPSLSQLLVTHHREKRRFIMKKDDLPS